MHEQITTRPKPHLLIVAVVALLLLAYQVVSVQRMRNEAQTLETSMPPGSLVNGKSEESGEPADALAASAGRASLYGDMNLLASEAGLSLSSYEEGQPVETNKAVLRSQEIALQATAAYPNLVAFLASLRAAHPNVALVSATVDRKAGESGRGAAGPIASTELLASIRLRAYWTAGAVDATRAP